VLDEARLISTQRGRGTYIWEQPTEEHMRELREHHLRELARQYLEGAARLGFDRQQALTALEAINLAGAEPTNEGNAEEPRSNERQG
jgi:GntR family transcriptional regulator